MRAVGYVVAAICFIAIAFIAGASKAEQPAMNEAEREAVRVARDYVATHFPDFDLAGRPPIVSGAFATVYMADFSGKPPAEFDWPPRAGSPTHSGITVTVHFYARLLPSFPVHC